MKYIFAIMGLFLSFGIIKWREDLGNSMGNMTWMRYFGGPYVFMVLVGVIMFFWSLATITGTEDIFLAPIIFLVPGLSTDNQVELTVDTF